MKAPQSRLMKNLKRKGYSSKAILDFYEGKIELGGYRVTKIKEKNKYTKIYVKRVSKINDFEIDVIKTYAILPQKTEDEGWIWMKWFYRYIDHSMREIKREPFVRNYVSKYKALRKKIKRLRENDK